MFSKIRFGMDKFTIITMMLGGVWYGIVLSGLVMSSVVSMWPGAVRSCPVVCSMVRIIYQNVVR